jgi:hypothetical protein
MSERLDQKIQPFFFYPRFNFPQSGAEGVYLTAIVSISTNAPKGRSFTAKAALAG